VEFVPEASPLQLYVYVPFPPVGIAVQVTGVPGVVEVGEAVQTAPTG
jgi:hypothetical protein